MKVKVRRWKASPVDICADYILRRISYREYARRMIRIGRGYLLFYQPDNNWPPLTPSHHGEDCLGNGNHPGIECCCDNCDHFLDCFPEFE